MMNMKDILKGINPHLKLLWFDTACIYRNVEIEKGTGADGVELKLIHEFIACKYSQKETNTNQTESNNLVEYTHKLFYDTDVDILAGDEIWIMIKDTNVIRKFTATDANIYFSHNEVNLKFEGSA